MPGEFVHRRRVEFADTDTAQVIHFTALFRYMEEAEHAFYRSLGFHAYAWSPERVVGMPRVSASLDFLGAVRYGDELAVRLLVRRVGAKSIGYEAVFEREGAEGEGPAVVARGTMTVVYAIREHGTRDWVGTELPELLRERLQPLPEEGTSG